MRSYRHSVAALLTISLLGALLAVAVLVSAWRQEKSADWLLLGVGSGLLSALSAVFAWRINSTLREPIHTLIEGAARIGEGDYTMPLGLTEETELAPLQSALEQMRLRLQQTSVDTRYLNTVLDSMNDAVLVTDTQGQVTRCNEAARQLFGYNDTDMTGKSLRTLLAPTYEDTDQMPLKDLQESVIRTASGQTIPVSISGSEISTANDEFRGTIYVMRDITERKRAERRIRYLARFDALTKLPNRMQFQHVLQQTIARARRADRVVALLYLDLDRYKEINDTFGHEAGDRTLEILSERLTRALPREAVLGRLAGDEFAVFIESANDSVTSIGDVNTYIANLARTILAEISKAFYVQQHELFLTASIGVAFCPSDAENVIDLIRHADAAMYHAKQNGGNNFVYYTPEMNAAAVERLMLKSKLRRALERNELVMLYQPKIDLRLSKVVGAEALLRWRLPGHGDIAPSQFIPLAEESSLILAIGDWVMDRVCLDYRLWQSVFSDPGRISINLSLKQLRQSSFVARCRNLFKRYDLDPTNIELEITETTLMQDPPRTIRLLNELHDLGVHLSIDDFGTGYSSLSALQQFPIGTLKIDQSFVRRLNEDKDAATIVRTIIDMGKSMNMEVVAEGVETIEQLQYIKQHNCHYAQGHLLGRAMSADEFLNVMRMQAKGQFHIAALSA